MKSKFAVGLLAVGLFSFGALAGCGKKGSSSVMVEYGFTISLSNGSKTLNKGEEAHIIIDEVGVDPAIKREFTYVSSDAEVASVNNGTVLAKKAGTARITVTESVSQISQILSLSITDADPASGGYNFASLAGEEAVNKRTEILGQLEKYAMDNHLTGITLFENGGYVKYSERVTLPTTNYITGYGFGLLSEGSVDSDMKNEENPAYKRYLHSATSSDPKMINARNNTGSQVSDLEGYITSSFWGTKMNKTKDQYVWYPVLAKDKVKYDGKDVDFTRPTPIYNDEEVKPGQEPNPLGLYSTWRIYVKTGDSDGIKYRYSGNAWGNLELDGRKVTIDDYEFAYRLLITGSHKLERGAEFAGDQTYGIVGAQRYYNNTKNSNDEQARTLWENMKKNGQLGIKTGTDATNGAYIQLTLLNPIDRFTAMYALSSNLISPLPEAFIEAIGGGSVVTGSTRYGSFNNSDASVSGHQDKILDHVLSVGPYMLEDWVKNQTIIFKKNDQWNEPGRYNIAGIKLIVIDTSTSTTAIYDRFTKGDLDSCGIPTKYIDAERGQARVYKTKGDATFKLNVNSCTQEVWDDLNKKLWKESTTYKVKPWMSNDNFLNGLFYSINRKAFADKRGVQPTINYFSDAYLYDPENGKSYNDSEAHKKAVEAYQTYDSEGNSTYGYSKDRAILSFRAAVKELVAKYPNDIKYGTADKPFVIKIHIRWMYQTDEKEYGEDIAKYFTDAFNDPAVCDGKIKLEVEQAAVTNWMDVYTEYLMKGQFDLGFGAISGNTYNPLNFLEVLKSDNSSGFTLNWGTDTSKITRSKPLIYDNKMWSFDALWAVADHGGVVNDGSVAKTVQKCFMVAGKDKFYEGVTFQVATQFINVPAAVTGVTRVQIFIFGSGGVDVEYVISNVDGKVVATVTLTADQALEIDNEIRRVNHMDDKDKYPSLWKDHAFTLENYDKLWSIQLSYSLAIVPEGSDKAGTPTESYVDVAKNEASWKDE